MSFKGIELNPGKGGSKVAADVVTEGAESREFQRVKLVFGPEGTITAVETGVGLPVSGTVSVSGAVDTELPAAAALADATANPTTTSVGSFVHGYNGTTWDRLRSTTANGLVVDVSRVQGSVDTELPAAAALADATANPTTPLVGAALELYNGTTWDRWRGTTTNGARVQVMAQTMTSDTTTSGNIVAAAGTVAITVSGSGTASLELRGTFTATLVFEGTEDGTNWFSIPCLERSPTPGTLATGSTVTGFWLVPCGGLSQVRVRASAFTSGPVTVGWNIGSGTSVVHATDGGGSLSVDGTVAVTQATASSLNAEVQGDAASDAPVSGNPVLMGFRASTATPSAVSADGDAVAARSLRTGEQCVTIHDGSGDSCMDNTNDALRVNVVAGSAGGVSIVDDAPFTVAVSSIVPVGGTYRGTRDLVDDGDAGAFAMTQRRGVLVSPETPAGDSLCDDTSDTLKVGGGVQTDASVASLAPVLTGARAADARIGAVSADGDAVPIRTNRHGEGYAHLLTPNGDSVADDTNDAIRVNVVAGAGSGGTAMTDDAAFTPGTTSITPVGGTYRSVRDALDDNDAGAIALTQTRAVYTTLETPAGDTMVDETNDAVRVNVVTFTSKGIPNEPTTDTITSNGDEVLETEPDGRGVLGIDITGTWVATLQFEGTYNLSDYFAISAYPVGGVTPVTSTTANGRWIVQGAGMARLRVRASAYTSGTATVKFNGSVAGWVPPTQFAEDAAHVSGDVGTLALAVRRDTAASSSGTDGDYSTLNVNASGRLYTSATIDAALPAGTNNIGDVDVLSLPALPAGTNNIGDVDVLTLPGVTGAAAHDAAVSGNPVLVGLEARSTDGTAVGSGDAVRAAASLTGKQLVLNGALPGNLLQGNITVTDNSAHDVIAAQGAGIKIAITSITVTNSHASVSTTVTFRDGTTAKFGPQYALAGGGGFTLSSPTPLFVTAANAAATVICGTTGSNTYVTLTGYATTD